VDDKSFENWTLGSRLRHARQLQGLAQGDFQELGGPSRITISRIEKGVGIPGRTYRVTLEAVCGILGCRTDWLQTGLGEIWEEGKAPAADPRFGGGLAHRIKRRPRPAPSPDGQAIGLGVHLSTGPVDWLIAAKAMEHLDAFVNGKRGRSTPEERHSQEINKAFALQVLYAHLAQLPDPLGPVDDRDLQTLMSVAFIR